MHIIQNAVSRDLEIIGQFSFQRGQSVAQGLMRCEVVHFTKDRAIYYRVGYCVYVSRQSVCLWSAAQGLSGFVAPRKQPKPVFQCRGVQAAFSPPCATNAKIGCTFE